MGSFEKVGDWAKVHALCANLGKELEAARQLSLKRWGLKAEAIATKHMSSQDLNWKPLDPTYLASKIRKGLSEDILTATSDYFQAIQSWVDTKTGTSYAGVKKTVRDREDNLIADIAAVHEFGSKSGKIPPRPLWQPTYKETVAWFWKSNSTPERIFMKNIKRYL